MIKPIKRSEVTNKTNFWPQTIEAFNELIREKWHNDKAKILQKEVVARIISKLASEHEYSDSQIVIHKELIFSTHQLDVESLYREEGFTVEYDKPGLNETYEAYFIFT